MIFPKCLQFLWLHLTLWSIHFYFCMWWGNSEVSFSAFVCPVIQMPLVENIFLLPPNGLGSFDKINYPNICETISRLSLPFYWSMFSPNDLCVYFDTNNKLSSLSWIHGKFGSHKVWFFQICSLLKTYLAILESLHFHINCRIISSISARKPARILIGTVFNLWINFQRIP